MQADKQNADAKIATAVKITINNFLRIYVYPLFFCAHVQADMRFQAHARAIYRELYHYNVYLSSNYAPIFYKNRQLFCFYVLYMYIYNFMQYINIFILFAKLQMSVSKYKIIHGRHNFSVLFAYGIIILRRKESLLLPLTHFISRHNSLL